MKKFKKIVSVLAAAAVLAIAPGTNALKAEAATPTTFYLKFDTDQNDWRMQVNEWQDEYEGRELYYLNEGSEKAKDGDIVIILPNETNETNGKEIKINVHLSNLTVNRAHAVVAANGGVDECYVLGDSYAAVTGAITNAYVYDNATCTFNSNVTNLNLIATQSNETESNVSVGGTVSYVSLADSSGVYEEFYNFPANSFYHDETNGIMTDPAKYSTSGNGPATSAPAASAAPSQSNTSQGSTSSSNEYDDVPKTGENNMAIWLLAISVACFTSCVMMSRKIQ